MFRRFNDYWTFLQQRYTNGQRAYKKCSKSLVIRKIQIKTIIDTNLYSQRCFQFFFLKRKISVDDDMESQNPVHWW